MGNNDPSQGDFVVAVNQRGGAAEEDQRARASDSASVNSTVADVVPMSSLAPEAVEEAVKSLALKNADGDAVTYVSHRILEAERKQILSTAFPDAADPNHVVSITTKGSG